MIKCALGIDIGSISTKGVIIDEDNNIISSEETDSSAFEGNATEADIRALKRVTQFGPI